MRPGVSAARSNGPGLSRRRAACATAPGRRSAEASTLSRTACGASLFGITQNEPPAGLMTAAPEPSATRDALAPHQYPLL
jgi:hypothetical protein